MPWTRNDEVPMDSEIVQELQNPPSDKMWCGSGGLMDRGANEIIRLKAENKKLRQWWKKSLTTTDQIMAS